jgi:hypothetical protein
MRRITRFSVVGVLFLAITQSNQLIAQVTTTDPATAAIVAKALAALSTRPVHSAVISGTATANAGSTHESGTFNLQLQSTGESDFSLSAGKLTSTETTSGFDADPACTWSGADGVKHAAVQHNCLLALNWAIPVVGFQARSAKLAIVNAPKSADSGLPLSVSLAVKSSSKAAARYSKLTTVIVSFDNSSLLPQSFSYNVHPDDDEQTDIPILVRYSDYRKVDGASIPFHIQKYINNTLNLDLQIESASVQ